ncbi:DUF59 domain-containing protein [Gordonia sp. HNM0687]|uniref:DUF59 domain-containing protein n=1 Tax=Gordonia mangrovi TaxID=2665643 RepID=A0A6L7GNF3_9ACTN|nr:iron-sulfur cluster assembly protein [Gordonia mangrovi]MXP21440.1 DUF59 domain-containing protein [Gordonia mangrovi]UVF80187.1 iron-sulfur cluster assembly protein [Gordonia mangrovi]
MITPSVETILEKLAGVVDPCSVAADVPLSIVDMGMVESVDADDDGLVRIALRLTAPMCHQLPYFEMSIEECLGDVVGVTGVECSFDHGQHWTAEMLTPAASLQLRSHREAVAGRAGRADLRIP